MVFFFLRIFFVISLVLANFASRSISTPAAAGPSEASLFFENDRPVRTDLALYCPTWKLLKPIRGGGVDEGENCEVNDENNNETEQITENEDSDSESGESSRDDIPTRSAGSRKKKINSGRKKPSVRGRIKSVKQSSSLLERGSRSVLDVANLAAIATRKTAKAALDLIASKHVSKDQILGKWRMEQEIIVNKDVVVTCPATIEFLEGRTLSTCFDDRTYKSEYKFKEKKWPQKCSIEFEATAFQGPRDKEPVSLFYKGYFKKSLMNSRVVLIRGSIYKLSGNLLWKRQVKCGKFKSTKTRYS